ncbi:MAG: hypothetical protein GY874_11190 [Desulfobacteraceae bacterium]|nr:hypothetical protein [Desulfobacteraceae bacterium]
MDRLKRITRYWSLTILILMGWCCTAANAFQMVEKDPWFFYYPENENTILQNLIDACEPITSFLASKGLSVPTPMHIVLDDKLDLPRPQVQVYPHLQIRIPVRAPGVLENGFTEPDPWLYYLFTGLSLQGIYSERSGVPGGLHHVFGQIMSPNLIMPDWTIDGICHLLYEEYMNRAAVMPLYQSIKGSGPIPDLDKVSNHPEIWPGRLSFRIYGRPFILWLNEQYGWGKLYLFLQLHGKSIIPIEIDRKAQKVFGKTWNQLWRLFREQHTPIETKGVYDPIYGYWPKPFVYWNETGVYPGLIQTAIRGRYGFVDSEGWLWLNIFENGKSQLLKQKKDTVRRSEREHVWDPGPGQVAVTRKGSSPFLIVGAVIRDDDLPKDDLPGSLEKQIDIEQRLIPAPPGTIQLSGPVMDEKGRIVAAGNTNGNWDIWLYDKRWRRLTTAYSIEMDPWLSDGKLFYTSNYSGKFQIHTGNMVQLTHSHTAAAFPRQYSYLELGDSGWKKIPLSPSQYSMLSDVKSAKQEKETAPRQMALPYRDYSAFRSIRSNYLLPDLFIGDDDFQFGISTQATDVSKNYSWDTGLRYSLDEKAISWRLGGQAKQIKARATHYRLGYTTERQMSVKEKRYEIKTGWNPQILDDLEIAANWRWYARTTESAQSEQEWWASLNHQTGTGNLQTQITLDLFAQGSQSAYGKATYWLGQKIITVMGLQAGKTWGDLLPGHNSFRIGGNSGEGFFTKRPSRLFALRGFKSNCLDSGLAATGNIEIYWPLVRLQTGYKTLPLFLHNISVGTFVDSGFSEKTTGSHDFLLSSGFEIITGLELAWGFMADFRFGWAWPLVQPDDFDESGVIFLLQIGRPM